MENTKVQLKVGIYTFKAELLENEAPKTCAAFKALLPLKNQFIHVRWSGEGLWIPYGDIRLGIDYENHTSHPAAGEFLLYPGGISEMEMILSYGRCLFASQHGQLSGNHFLTIVEGLENLYALGRKTLMEGAQDLEITLL